MQYIFPLVSLCKTYLLLNQNKFQRDFKSWNDISCFNTLPDFKNNFITNNAGDHIYAGTIIKRPLRKPFSSFEYHYGIVMGTTFSESELVLEMTTSGRDIHFTTKEEFLDWYKPKDFSVYYYDKNISRDTIIERAKLVQYETYSLLDFNCKNFAILCATGHQTTKFSPMLIDICNSILKIEKTMKG